MIPKVNKYTDCFPSLLWCGNLLPPNYVTVERDVRGRSSTENVRPRGWNPRLEDNNADSHLKSWCRSHNFSSIILKLSVKLPRLRCEGISKHWSPLLQGHTQASRQLEGWWLPRWSQNPEQQGKERADLQAILLTSTGVTHAHTYDTRTHVHTHTQCNYELQLVI